MTKSSEKSITEYTTRKVSEIVALYATMINGQLINSDLPVEEQIAGVLCAGDIVKQATSMVLLDLCQRHGVSPAWTLSDQDIKRSAAQFAERMVSK
jgi:hypothetical protein